MSIPNSETENETCVSGTSEISSETPKVVTSNNSDSEVETEIKESEASSSTSSEDLSLSSQISKGSMRYNESERNYKVVFFVRYHNQRPLPDAITAFFSKYGTVDHVKCPIDKKYVFVFMNDLSIQEEYQKTSLTIRQIIQDMKMLDDTQRFHIAVANSKRGYRHRDSEFPRDNYQRRAIRPNFGYDYGFNPASPMMPIGTGRPMPFRRGNGGNGMMNLNPLPNTFSNGFNENRMSAPRLRMPFMPEIIPPHTNQSMNQMAIPPGFYPSTAPSMNMFANRRSSMPSGHFAPLGGRPVVGGRPVERESTVTPGMMSMERTRETMSARNVRFNSRGGEPMKRSMYASSITAESTH